MYLIPDSTKSEITAFAKFVQEFRKGEIEPIKIKANRAPMGICEQRINGTDTIST